MLKAGLFTLGLASGVYYGIKMRDAGFTNSFTKHYYAKNTANQLKVQDLKENYEKGVLDSPDKVEKLRILNSVEDLEKSQTLLLKEREKSQFKKA